MATQAQITANRRNALRSTGPKTDAGKRRVSHNARKHGLRSKDPDIAVQETAGFQPMLDSWIESLKPRNPAEEEAVVRLVCANFQRLRVAELEARLFLDVDPDNLDAKTRYIAGLSTKAHYNLQAAIALWDRLVDLREAAQSDQFPAASGRAQPSPGKNEPAQSNPIPAPQLHPSPGKNGFTQTNPNPEPPANPSTPPAHTEPPGKNSSCEQTQSAATSPGTDSPAAPGSRPVPAILRSMKLRRLLLAPLFVVILIVGLASDRTVAPYAKWMAGDFHEHSYFTDGSRPIRGVVRNAFRYGLHWVANSEHGGTSMRDDEGDYWDDPEVYAPFPAKGDPNEVSRKNSQGEEVKRKTMWRWQTLTDYVWPVILELRGEFPERLVASGLEWNVPGHEHCSVGIVDRDASLLSEFEYRFDSGDRDNSGGPAGEWAGKNHADEHTRAVEAVLWMKEHRPKTSWIVFAHPERVSSYTAAAFRDFNDAAPEIAFGFEGLPGHQKSARRGGYRERAVGGGTYGGAGAYIAEVGGLWDALLGEGRHWWNFVSSDFHSPSSDFWPGEYAKTWTHVQDLDRDGRYVLEEVAAGLRSGNSYAVHGDLIDQLDFTATAATGSATMGETLQVKHNGPMSLNISFRLPETNYNGDAPKVRLIQVIAGEVHDPAPKFLAGGTTPNPAYEKETNDTAKIVAIFREDELEYERAGWYRAPEFKIASLDKDMYYRIRGTNLPPGTPNETDAEGSPLADATAREDLEAGRVEAAWKDLWFYSNPIFVDAVE